MKKIFITGGLGFLGSKLAAEALKKGHSVMLYDSLIFEQDYNAILDEIRKESGVASGTLEFVLADTRNSEMLRNAILSFKPDFLFHFAELAGIYICNKNPKYTEDINYLASKKVLDIASELKIPTIYNSTSNVYGNQKDLALLSENVPLPEPSDEYSRYKIKMEEYVKEMSAKNPDWKIIVLRPATIWGVSPRMRLELLPSHFTYCAIAKGVIKIAEQEAYRAEIDVDDMIEAYLKIIETKAWPKLIYNVGHQNMKKIEIAKIIQSVTGCTIEAFGNLGDSRNLQIDSASFSADFGWTPKYSFEETVRKMKKWIEDHRMEFEKNQFSGVINTPLSEWLKII